MPAFSGPVIASNIYLCYGYHNPVCIAQYLADMDLMVNPIKWDQRVSSHLYRSILCQHRMFPTHYLHGLVVLCFVVIIPKVIMGACDSSANIGQGYLIGPGTIICATSVRSIPQQNTIKWEPWGVL